MDPNACLELILDCIADGAWHDAAEHAVDLRNWMQAGGFPPVMTERTVQTLIDWADRMDGPKVMVCDNLA